MDAQEADLFPFMERALAVNGHSNGAVRMEGGRGMKREEAWERPVASRESATGVIDAP